MTKHRLMAGIDEAGRGPLAGPVCAAAVILGENHDIHGLADSKALSAERREFLAYEIKQKAIAWAVEFADTQEIEQRNILQATLNAMQRATCRLQPSADLALIDGNRAPELAIESRCIVKGDQTVAEISAASILAKVERDRLMQDYDRQYPVYGFSRHKGYGTRAHLEALELHGPCPIHRRDFAPVRKILERLGGR